MPVLSRDALEESPLADLHVLAGELGIDGYRRLRKADLVDAILARQGGDDGGEPAPDEEDEEKPRRRGRRGGRGRGRAKDDDEADEEEEAKPRRARGARAEADADEEEEKPRRGRARGRAAAEDDADEERPRRGRGRAAAEDDADEEKPRRGRGRAAAQADSDEVEAEAEADDEEKPRRTRGGRGRGRARDADREAEPADEDGAVTNGVVELLGNGSGFLRVSPPEPSDDDVYISAAQVRRCELVSGDEVSGPVRPPRRSERYPSLVRIDTINGRSADEVAEGTPFDDLPAALPDERLALGAEDATLKAIEWLTPLGRGSRATIVGGPRAGKTEALRRLAGALASQEDLDVTVVLAGVRPEEVADWKTAGVEPATVLSFAASADAQAQAIERVVETAKRLASRGGNAVVLVDSLTYLHPPAARKAIAAARNIVDGGSLTIVATADEPVGGETTVIALDVGLTSTGRFPALDLVASGTLKPELLVGDAGADAIAQARAAALG